MAKAPINNKKETEIDVANKKATQQIMISASLASRVRPKTFKEIVGQKDSVAKLRGMLKKGKLPGAILIIGNPGLGKTTLARVFARYVNCETHNACGKCTSCLIDIDKHPDITEVNMGVDRGIDDSRSLVQKAKYAPRFNCRIILCDEVHNLTGPAEQALLKTLEEPPAGTLFILCTTNPEKLKPAILSRCTLLDLKSVAIDELVERLVVIAQLEGEDFDNKQGRSLLNTIANYSNGQVREAISILEGVIFAKAGSKNVDLKEVAEQFAAKLETSLDIAAAKTVVAFLKLGLKGICSQAAIVDSCRQLVMKMRWVCMNILDDYAGRLKFKSYSFKTFLDLLDNASIPYSLPKIVPDVIMLLALLNEIEQKMNQTNADERSLFLGDICKYVLLKKREED